MSTGPHKNYQAKAGTKNEPDSFFVPDQKRVGKSILTFRTYDLVNFLFKGFRSTPKKTWDIFEIQKEISERCMTFQVTLIERDRMFIILHPPKGENDDHDDENFWISG